MKRMKQFVPAVFLSIALLAPSAFSQVVIRVAPPPPVVEHPGPVPHRGYVWVSGHYRWNGRRYVWVPGHYMRPPRPGAVWVPDRYERRGNGYVYIRGYWR